MGTGTCLLDSKLVWFCSCSSCRTRCSAPRRRSRSWSRDSMRNQSILHKMDPIPAFQCWGSPSPWCGCVSGFDLSPWCGFGCGSGFWFLFNADPDEDFYLMRIRTLAYTNIGSNHADPDLDPQHCNIYKIFGSVSGFRDLECRTS